MTTIDSYTYGALPNETIELAGADWETGALAGEEERVTALYAAIGADEDDEDVVIGRLPDGRLAVSGLTVSGHPFAVERRAV